MKLINCDEPVIECLDPEFLDRIAEGRMRANQNPRVRLQECADRIRLASF